MQREQASDVRGCCLEHLNFRRGQAVGVSVKEEAVWPRGLCVLEYSLRLCAEWFSAREAWKLGVDR